MSNPYDDIAGVDIPNLFRLEQEIAKDGGRLSFVTFRTEGPVRFMHPTWIVERPQLPFLPEYLIVPERFAEWEILGFRLGCIMHLQATGTPMLMEPFIVKMDEAIEMDLEKILKERDVELTFHLKVPKRPDWQMPKLRLPVVQVGQDISISVVNPTPDPIPFRAMLMGRVPKY